jgi:hypothetical protein
VKLNGNGLDKVAAARVIVKDAKDDKGNSLVKKGSNPTTARDVNSGTLQVAVGQPARSATSVRLKGPSSCMCRGGMRGRM